MLEALLIEHCSPTLAGLKTGSLFSCPYEYRAELISDIRSFNMRLHKKGLRIIPLRISESRALIYVYRPDRLAADLSDSAAANLLLRCGYPQAACERCILRLISRLTAQGDFPHEIGLFLGYPPEDVQGFIENRAANFKCLGCWKVYGNVKKAEETFAKYKKCTDIYCKWYKSGIPLEKLALAC